MIAPETYVRNLMVAEHFRDQAGMVVECGTWRGGMIAGIAELLGNAFSYQLFDSFEGLPPAKPIDGEAALQWQADVESPTYFDNCTADQASADTAMRLSGATHYSIYKGWFSETLPQLSPQPIAILRLDADWYDSTMDCLTHLYPRVAVGGVVIIDDYYTWDGCTQAVHDYLSHNKICDRIRQFDDDVCFIVKDSSR